MDRIYILRSDGAYGSFYGMTQEQITTMLLEQGFTVTFIDQATYQSAPSPLQGH